MIAKQARRLGIYKETEYPSKQLTEWEKGYLAGIIDGEGCIALKRGKRPRKDKTFHYSPWLRISNTDPAIINQVLHIIGCGSTHSHLYGEYKRTNWKYQIGYKGISWLFP